MTAIKVGESRQLKKYWRDEAEKVGLPRPMHINDIEELKVLVGEGRRKMKVEKYLKEAVDPESKVQAKLFTVDTNLEAEKGDLDERANEQVNDFWQTIEAIRDVENKRFRPKDLINGGSGELVTVAPSGASHVFDGRGLYPKESYEGYQVRKDKSKKDRQSVWRF
jgi:hypothetical protein